LISLFLVCVIAFGELRVYAVDKALSGRERKGDFVIWHQGMQNLAAAEVSMRPDASSGLMNSVSVLGKPDLRDGLHMAFSSSSMVTRSLQPTTLRATTASASPATGGQVTVFGPQKYLRTTGAPNQYTSTFLLPPWALAPFVLHIQNGAATGG